MGGILVIFYSHKVTFKENSGRGTNNKDEGLVLKYFLKLSLEASIKDFRVYGDSKLWIESMRGAGAAICIISISKVLEAI